MITYFVLWCYLLIQGIAHNTGVLPLAKRQGITNNNLVPIDFLLWMLNAMLHVLLFWEDLFFEL
jgi:hypothetical protein